MSYLPVQVFRRPEIPDALYSRIVGSKQYELTDHLGNVHAVLTDRRIYETNEEIIPEVVFLTDYYPFGMSRNRYILEDYRYGFNGKENDNEVKGTGNQQDYGFRIYNPTLGKFLSVDPISADYPMLTPYQFASNSPIDGIDLDGLEHYYAADGSYLGQVGTSESVLVVKTDIAEKLENDVNRIHNVNERAKEIGLNIAYDIGMTRAELHTRAFLTLVRVAEKGNVGEPLEYNVNYGGSTFDSYKDHPNKSVTKWGRTSTAAGAYQILNKTWKIIKKLKKLADFSPKSQDIAAVEIINQQDTYNPSADGVFQDVKDGNVIEAAKKLNRTWTSLPGGKEEHVNEEEAQTIFNEAIKDELNSKSKIATPNGELLNGY